MERLERDEKDRVAQQIKRLGPEGLEQAAALLESSKAAHDKPIPKEILTSFPVPDVDSISWIPVQSVQEPGVGRKLLSAVSGYPDLSKHVEIDGPPLPFFVEYDSVKVGLLLRLGTPSERFFSVGLCHSSCILLPC